MGEREGLKAETEATDRQGAIVDFDGTSTGFFSGLPAFLGRIRDLFDGGRLRAGTAPAGAEGATVDQVQQALKWAGRPVAFKRHADGITEFGVVERHGADYFESPTGQSEKGVSIYKPVSSSGEPVMDRVLEGHPFAEFRLAEPAEIEGKIWSYGYPATEAGWEELQRAIAAEEKDEAEYWREEAEREKKFWQDPVPVAEATTLDELMQMVGADKVELRGVAPANNEIDRRAGGNIYDSVSAGSQQGYVVSGDGAIFDITGARVQSREDIEDARQALCHVGLRQMYDQYSAGVVGENATRLDRGLAEITFSAWDGEMPSIGVRFNNGISRASFGKVKLIAQKLGLRAGDLLYRNENGTGQIISAAGEQRATLLKSGWGAVPERVAETGLEVAVPAAQRLTAAPAGEGPELFSHESAVWQRGTNPAEEAAQNAASFLADLGPVFEGMVGREPAASKQEVHDHQLHLGGPLKHRGGR